MKKADEDNVPVDEFSVVVLEMGHRGQVRKQLWPTQGQVKERPRSWVPVNLYIFSNRTEERPWLMKQIKSEWANC